MKTGVTIFPFTQVLDGNNISGELHLYYSWEAHSAVSYVTEDFSVKIGEEMLTSKDPQTMSIFKTVFAACGEALVEAIFQDIKKLTKPN